MGRSTRPRRLVPVHEAAALDQLIAEKSGSGRLIEQQRDVVSAPGPPTNDSHLVAAATTTPNNAKASESDATADRRSSRSFHTDALESLDRKLPAKLSAASVVAGHNNAANDLQAISVPAKVVDTTMADTRKEERPVPEYCDRASLDAKKSSLVELSQLDQRIARQELHYYCSTIPPGHGRHSY
jgi:hypothetical protein